MGNFEPRPEGWIQTLLVQLDNPNPYTRYEALGQLRSMKKEKDIAELMRRRLTTGETVKLDEHTFITADASGPKHLQMSISRAQFAGLQRLKFGDDLE